MLGEMLEMDGTGLLTVKESAADVPPPGAGVKTVMESVPAEAMSDAEMNVVNWVELTKVVDRLAPLTFTTEAETKLLPVKVNVKPLLPAMTLEGEMLESAGAGLFTASDKAPEVEPSGFTISMVRVPADAMSLEGIAAVS